MRWHLYKMGVQGAIATINLVAFGVALAVWLATSQGTGWNIINKPWVHGAALIMLKATTFPLIWIGDYLGTKEVSPCVAILYLAIVVPLNAYLWGFLGERGVRHFCDWNPRQGT